MPPVDFASVGKAAPVLLATPAGQLPKASAVVMTWTEAEWAAMQHVFCASAGSMPYSDRLRGTWPGWQEFSSDLPAGALKSTTRPAAARRS